MRIGYARVSTKEQNESRQIEIFQSNGIERIYLDKQSGKNCDRPQLAEMLSFVRDGDIVVVESISRLARNTRDLLDIVEKLTAKNAVFVSLKENIDTNTVSGKFMLTVFGAMAELERGYILERQAEGIAIAKREGKYKGRARILTNDGDFVAVCKRWKDGEITAREAMNILNLKPNTFYRRVKENGIQ